MKENNIQPPHLKLVSDLMCCLSEYSTKTGRRVTGQATIETPQLEVSKHPMVVMYFCNEKGQYMVWFADQFKFHLYARMGKVTKRICSVLVRNAQDLQKEIDKLRPLLEK